MNVDWQKNEAVAAPILDARVSSPSQETGASLLRLIVALGVMGAVVLLSDRFLLSFTERGPGAIEDFLPVYLISAVIADMAMCAILGAGVSSPQSRVCLLVVFARYAGLLLAVAYGWGDRAYALRGNWQQAADAPAEYSQQVKSQWQKSYRSAGPQYACEFYRDTLTIREQGHATSLKFSVEEPADAQKRQAMAGNLVLRGESELYASFELRPDGLLLLIEVPHTRRMLQPLRRAANGGLLPGEGELTLRPLWLVRSAP